MPRHKRTGFVRPQEELEKLRPARLVLIAVCEEYPVNAEAYRRARAAIEAIDRVAEALVGDLEYFWAPMERSKLPGPRVDQG